MLRIHFTAEDLARTRVAATLGAAAETYYSLEMLCRPSLPLPFQRWRSSVAGRLSKDARPLTALLPVRGPGLDLLALAGDSPDIGHAVEALLRASPTLMRREVGTVTVDPAHMSWARAVADGDNDARRLLAAGLVSCHQATVAPYWAAARTRLDAVRAQYARTFLDGGVDALLASLSPQLMRWRPPVLEVRYPRPVEVHLGGQGLILVPTLFSWHRSSLLHDPYDDTVVPRLTVPAVTDPANGTALWHPGGVTADEALGALLGHTRAAALRATADGCSTTELAARLGVSPPAASQHAKALRDARLITTSRRGGSVLHTTTALGRELLDGAQQRGPAAAH
ncbi:helix-turn-helix domain-containing protein [Streptomyces candidus]|uniref:DNA-binding transcriptional ArsR family regulator n=1 Tax=Streptomyces candidus TaxID=67283 RepID=A0A7X0HJX4_9ACTN|nr:helix-turn-helix domain-containing protein [Streptomyces candidus]MBB6438858.1 DNA-binding transcriptional ArsR family regulator [Streptomyces candidus]